MSMSKVDFNDAQSAEMINPASCTNLDKMIGPAVYLAGPMQDCKRHFVNLVSSGSVRRACFGRGRFNTRVPSSNQDRINSSFLFFTGLKQQLYLFPVFKIRVRSVGL